MLPLLLMNLLLNHISFVLLFFILCALVACIVFIISFSCFCLCDLHFRVAVGYETCCINQFAMPKYELFNFKANLFVRVSFACLVDVSLDDVI